MILEMKMQKYKIDKLSGDWPSDHYPIQSSLRRKSHDE